MARDDGQPNSSEGIQGARRLSPNEQAIAAELRRLDPNLAGLFERGLALADEIDEPGVRYLVAHIGREVSRGVIAMLTGETTVTPPAVVDDEQSVGDAEKEERFRTRIAAALELSETHPNVSAWFRSHQSLVSRVHWRNPPSSASAVREGFVTLVSLLFGRIAPYFDTQAELDRLLQITNPTEADAKRVQQYAVRFTQRRYFFSRLLDASWLEPLATVGFFRNPPDRLVHEDGSWSIQQWPEGDALARLAREAPEIAIRELTAVPRNNQNPAVWTAVATAAVTLAPAEASRLVPVLVHALKNSAPVLFPRSIIEVVQRLADAGDHDNAFALTDALLFVKGTSSETKKASASASSEGR